MAGDPVDAAISRAAQHGIRYRLEKTITAPKSRPVEIYRRVARAFAPVLPAGPPN